MGDDRGAVEEAEMLLGEEIREEEQIRAEEHRDRIAMAMWKSYQAELARREQ